MSDPLFVLLCSVALILGWLPAIVILAEPESRAGKGRLNRAEQSNAGVESGIERSRTCARHSPVAVFAGSAATVAAEGVYRSRAPPKIVGCHVCGAEINEPCDAGLHG